MHTEQAGEGPPGPGPSLPKGPACQRPQLTDFPGGHKDLPSDPRVVAPVAPQGIKVAVSGPQGFVCVRAGCQLSLSWQRHGSPDKQIPYPRTRGRPLHTTVWKFHADKSQVGCLPVTMCAHGPLGATARRVRDKFPPPPNWPQLICNPGQEAKPPGSSVPTTPQRLPRQAHEGQQTCKRPTMAWCALHMLAREELSTWISMAWMGPAGHRSVTVACNAREASLAVHSPAWPEGSVAYGSV